MAPCLGGYVVATPRPYGSDLFVAVNFLDRSLSRPGRERQFYEDAHEFSRAAVSCAGPSALILIAEKGSLEAPKTALRSVTYACE